MRYLKHIEELNSIHSGRKSEVDGRHYHFVSIEDFESDINFGHRPYLEFAKVHANFYGTRLDSVEAVHKEGVLVPIEW